MLLSLSEASTAVRTKNTAGVWICTQPSLARGWLGVLQTAVGKWFYCLPSLLSDNYDSYGWYALENSQHFDGSKQDSVISMGTLGLKPWLPTMNDTRRREHSNIFGKQGQNFKGLGN